ncbi:transposase, partial [Patescibacteria group bacterium]|nr:transposase [Patescibacteria group bacterium]
RPGFYFITIVTQNRVHRFGSVGADPCVRPMNAQNPCVQPWECKKTVRLNNVGNMVHEYWNKIQNHFQFIKLHDFIVMPDHIHGIIEINRDHQINGRTHGSAPTLSTIIQWFKTKTTNQYIYCVHAKLWPPFETRFWQRNYYEHIIRDEDDYLRLVEYIQCNPANWDCDELRKK